MIQSFLRIIVTCCFSGMALSQTSYEIIDLGTLAGYSTAARAINDSSQVVGVSGGHAFLWDEGTMTDLGSFAGETTEAFDINNSSQIVGISAVGGYAHAFLWDSGVMIDLGSLGGGAAAATSINDSMQIVGNSFDPNFDNRAFLFENGMMIDLGLAGLYSYAFSINNSKKVVGFAADVGVGVGYIWQNGQITDLGSLGGNYTSARGINDISQVVGQSRLTGIGTERAFIWENGIMQDLGALTGTTSFALAINDSAQIVGYYNLSPSTYRACMWHDGSAYDLNTLIDPNAGWILTEARDINNKGEIVGVGNHNGQSRGFLLKPKTYAITSPVAGEKWIAGETDTIRWTGGQAGQFLQIDYSTDDGQTYNTIDLLAQADLNEYVWNIPNNLLSTKCRIKITDAQTSTELAVSDSFKIKGYLLTRLDANGQYVAFSSASHGWSYLNVTLWPRSWFSQFQYSTATDPYTNESYPNFFHSVPDSGFVDWPLWVEVFEENQCYWFTKIIGLGSSYKVEAQVKWKRQANKHLGSCFGFAASSFLAFNFRDQFFQKHQGIPNVDNIFNLNLTNLIQKTINGYYAHQFGKQSLDNDVTGQIKDPRTTLSEVMNMFKNDVVDVSTITIYASQGGAHTMAPISVTVDNTGPSRYRVNLYDSNNPGLNTPYILVDSLNNTWQDFTGLGLFWNGGNKFYLEIPVSNYLNTPILSKIKSDNSNGISNIEFYNPEKANIIYTASNGNRIGIVNGNLIDEIENGIAIFCKNGKPSDPIGYYIPDDMYSVIMNNITDSEGNAYLSVFKEHLVYSYERFDADSTQTDSFRFDEGFSVFSSDNSEKLVNLTVIAEPDSIERIFFIRNSVLRQNDSVYIKELDMSDLVIKNYGVAKTYDLEINERSETKEEIFQNPSISLADNTTHILVPNWADLTNSQLKIYIDNGNDGTIDDTLYVANTVDVKDEGSLLSPNSYNLAQNYPNPFNPVTRIQFSIPQRSNVTLKIYDVLGNEIATLVNEEKERGVYTVNFNASQLTSGIYFYRLQADSFVETKKMIFLK